MRLLVQELYRCSNDTCFVNSSSWHFYVDLCCPEILTQCHNDATCLSMQSACKSAMLALLRQKPAPAVLNLGLQELLVVKCRPSDAAGAHAV